jgi:peroxiredoxin Q/BCP
VFVIDKEGKILASEPGGPAATVEVVKKLVGGGAVPAAAEVQKVESNGVNGASKEDVEKAETAAQVADTAEKLDSSDKPVVV